VTGQSSFSPRTRGLNATSDGEFAPEQRGCQICGGRLLPGLDLGHQPVGDLVRTAAQLNQPETFYPLQLFQCVDCGLCQLGFTVDPAVVYQDFPFVSGTTATATRHLQSLGARIYKGHAGDQIAGANAVVISSAVAPRTPKYTSLLPS